MKYYKAKHDSYDYFSAYTAVENSLLTEKERNRLCPYITDRAFTIIEISKNNTYFSFGYRFECKN